MKAIVRSLLNQAKAAKRSARSQVARTLIRALTKVDDNFLAVQQQQPQRIAHDPDSQPAGGVGVNPCMRNGNTIVVNDSGAVIGSESVKLLVKSIFETSSLTAYQQGLVEALLAKSNTWQSPGAVADEIEAITLGEVREKSSPEAAQALAKLLEHRQKTKISAQAYNPSVLNNYDAMFWPDPTSDKKTSLFELIPFAHEEKIIDQSTKIGSAGSCFAMEIAHRLQQKGFNYVITEPSPNSKNGFSDSCAKWGTIFNAPSFRQLVDRSFGVVSLPPLAWTQKRNEKTAFYDPFREDLVFSSIEDLEDSWNRHLEASRKALEQVDVFIMTLGMNEVWRLRGTKVTFSRAPWRVAPDFVNGQVLTLQENLDELQTMLDTWRRFNPKLKIILSVSPVPLHATFRSDNFHIVTANAHSKAMLRVVADEFVRRNQGVYYFPSYETVMHCTRNAWEADQRHVSREAVDNVMRLFDRMFVKA